MAHSIDSCRLFFQLRDRAWTAAPESLQRLGCGCIHFQSEAPMCTCCAGGDADVEAALDDLREARLVYPVTERPECTGCVLATEEMMYIEPIDDLSAAMLLLARS